MDTGTIIGILLALFFGGLGLAYGGYSLETTHHLLAVFSYVLGGGCVAAAIALVFIVFAPPKQKANTITERTAQYVPTEVRLQFSGGNVLPTLIDQKNIWRWYTLATIFKGVNPTTMKLEEGARTWTVFLIYDKPTNFNEVRVESSSGRIPMHEVKDASMRGAVIIFSGT